MAEDPALRSGGGHPSRRSQFALHALSAGELIIGMAPVEHLSLGTDPLALPVPKTSLCRQLVAVLPQLAVSANAGRG
ncbi:MAG: hypothetical protein ACK55I_09555, partial [bacterium]